VQLYADGFDRLSLREKLLTWHLYLAALAGRDIYYDQRHVHNLEIRAVLEGILTHARELPPDVERRSAATPSCSGSTAALQRTHGAQEPAARSTPDAWSAPSRPRARRGAAAAAAGRTPRDLAQRCARSCSTPRSTRCSRASRRAGRDILQASANNLYVGVSMDDLASFRERHGLNSRLVNDGDRWSKRCIASAGKYDREIRRIVAISRMRSRLRRPPPPRRCARLVRFTPPAKTRTGWPTTSRGCATRQGTVDTINGFIEVYLDPRGTKGAWEGHGLLRQSRADPPHRSPGRARAVVRDHAPWRDDFRKPEVLGVTAKAIEVLVETGDSGPLTPVGINLPNDQAIRERFGSKSVSLVNVNEAYERSTPEAMRTEFSWDAAEAARAIRWGGFSRELTTELHEVIGHGSGRMAAHVAQPPHELLKEQYSAIEETRADLVALYFLPDPKLVELGLMPAEYAAEIVRAEFEQFTRGVLVQLAGCARGRSSKKTTCATVS
jgi:dipeptidyl-peptidase-3